MFLMSIKPLPSVFVRVKVSLTAIYASLTSYKSDLSIDAWNLICLLGLYLSSALPDWSRTSTYFLVINLGTLLDNVSSKFVIFWYLHGIKTISGHQ